MSEKWIPEIMYEEGEEDEASAIPFVMVPKDEEMPKLLYIFESKITNNFEPDMEGDEVPIYEWDLHQYADMNILKDNLDMETYDKVRLALGLEPIAIAAQKGREITQKIRNNLS